jgi:hypothetical protein
MDQKDLCIPFVNLCRAEKTFVPESVLKKRKTTEKIAAARLAETVQRKKVRCIVLLFCCRCTCMYTAQHHNNNTQSQIGDDIYNHN